MALGMLVAADGAAVWRVAHGQINHWTVVLISVCTSWLLSLGGHLTWVDHVKDLLDSRRANSISEGQQADDS